MNRAVPITIRRTGIIAAVFALALAAFETRAADVLQNFAGTFSKSGHVEVAGGNGVSTRGTCRLRFTTSQDGHTARLKITGEMKTNGARRLFSSIVALRRNNLAAVSNLAPGIDDGYSSDTGTYTASPLSIRGNFAFARPATTGIATISVRLKKRPRGTLLIVEQTLSTDALTRPITWKFRALSRP